ncbi:MAG: 3'(2'),5'-bisphosphate nucleotidase CysQ [Myxococcales bacterium FL481]|nr:MAG: 3'(2'),5'-bisphosphate nucleotidase CysQ [Myxococcales bacterium FL481]
MDTTSLLTCAIDAALRAGDEILAVYGTSFDVERKADDSPLTEADRRAHRVIVEGLQSTGLPVLSEEGADIPYDQRRDWDRFWLVDPLDGTKEFIKRNGEFTVNIALISDGAPVLGVIWVPVSRRLYFGAAEVGAYRADEVSPRASWSEYVAAARRLPCEPARDQMVVVASRSHPSPETEAFFEQLRAEHGSIELRSVGSSLKICLVAEGSADVYPRFGPTMEWDIAAGQAIAVAAGRAVVDHESGDPMRYNKANLRNGWFIVR